MNFEVSLPYVVGDCLPEFPDQIRLNLRVSDENLNFVKSEIESEVRQQILDLAKQHAGKSIFLTQLQNCSKNVDDFLSRQKLLRLRVEELQAARAVLTEEQPADLPTKIVEIDKKLDKAIDEERGNNSALETSLRREQDLLRQFKNDVSTSSFEATDAIQDGFKTQIKELGKKLMAIDGVQEILVELVELQFKADVFVKDEIDSDQ